MDIVTSILAGLLANAIWTLTRLALRRCRL